MRVLIVDDEYPARRELRAQLARFPDVQVVGEAASAEEAYELIAALNYDVVFLDIEMPGMSGMDLARRISRGPSGPRVVFTTAYPQYALEAFQVGAVGYLLKPFDEERLGELLDRIAGPRGALPAREAGGPAPAGPRREPGARAPSDAPASRTPPRIPVEKAGKTLLVHPSEIAFIYAQEEQVYVKLHSERLPCRFTLRQLDARLAPYGFLRVHRRFLVNLEKVREVVPYFKGSIGLVVADAERTEIPVSRGLTPLVRRRLGLREE
ncbi:LytR/AlgR family response regulator transcription factor [Caldinitratiruptor microaerophilus]|nr:LytTR family DNA-binding domain-containing protein [Caldinitratiruptor microaerophilus]